MAGDADTRCEVVLVALPGSLGPVLRHRLEALTFGPRPPEQRPATLIARALAGRLLAARWPQAAGSLRLLASGKPVAGSGGAGAPAVSISHTAGVVAVAVAVRGPVGVDVERVGRYRPRLATRVFAAADAEALAALPEAEQPLAFTRLWTVAEALAKLTGEGLGRAFGGLGPLGLNLAGTWTGHAWASQLAAPGVVVTVAGPEPLVPACAWLPFGALLA